MPRANKETKFGERSDLAHKAYMGIRQMLFYNEIIPGKKILSGHLKNVKDHILEKFDRMVMNKKEPIFDFHSFL